MAENVTLAPISSFTNDVSATAATNSNYTLIEDAFEDCLSLSGTIPNAMQANLDMNNKQIVNLPAPATVNSPARLIDVVNNPTLSVTNYLPLNNVWTGTNVFTNTVVFGSTTAFATIPAINLRNYGAVGNGVTDDTTAITAWLTAIQAATSPVVGYAPVGNYIFKSALSIGSGGKSNVTIHGDGPYSTIFTYAGATTTIDLLTIGDGTNQCKNWHLSNFKITSTTTMTAGTGFRMKRFVRSFLNNIIMDGQDGTGKLWNGFWFDSIDFVCVDGFEARGANDGLRVCGTLAGGQADLFLRAGKISGSNVGLRIGGGFGGFQIDDTDVIANNYNVIIDQTLTGTPNLQLFFGKGFASDVCNIGPGFQLVDVGLASESVLIFTGAWIASSPNVGLNIGPGTVFRVNFTGGTVTNCGHDGVYDQSGGTAVLSFVGVKVYNNGLVTGYGISSSSTAYINIQSCSFEGNGSGNIAPTVNPVIAGGATAVNSYFYPFGNGISMVYGSGAPTLAAAQGSLYLRTDGSSTTTRLYVNTNGSTGWTNVVTST